MAADADDRNLVRAEGHVTAVERVRLFGHEPHTLWFTGLSGSGKSTVAFAVERALIGRGVAAYVLDGDNTRMGLNRDLGFSAEDRTENIRRVGEVCHLLHDAGLVVLAAFISPYAADRQRVRELYPDGGFSEVHVATPLEVCEQRDVKGLYTRARAGEVPEFSGISAPYEAPDDPELVIDTSRPLDACVAQVLDHLGVDPWRAAGRPPRGSARAAPARPAADPSTGDIATRANDGGFSATRR